jgi:hypothetical protein
MIAAFLTSITLLPALLMLLRPEAEGEDVGFASLAPLDRYLARQRKTVLRIAALAGTVALVLTVFLRFDSNPLDLRSPKVESVSTLFDLMKNPETSPNTIDVAAPSLAAADAGGKALQPAAGRPGLTLSSFIPDDQDRKLAVIADANGFWIPPSIRLTSSRRPATPRSRPALPPPPPSCGQPRAMTPEIRPMDARRLADALASLAEGGPAEPRPRRQSALVPGLQTMLRQVSDSLTPQKVTLASIPAGHEIGMDRQRRQRPRPDLPQGHQQ